MAWVLKCSQFHFAKKSWKRFWRIFHPSTWSQVSSIEVNTAFNGLDISVTLGLHLGQVGRLIDITKAYTIDPAAFTLGYLWDLRSKEPSKIPGGILTDESPIKILQPNAHLSSSSFSISRISLSHACFHNLPMKALALCSSEPVPHVSVSQDIEACIFFSLYLSIMHAVPQKQFTIHSAIIPLSASRRGVSGRSCKKSDTRL